MGLKGCKKSKAKKSKVYHLFLLGHQSGQIEGPPQGIQSMSGGVFADLLYMFCLFWWMWGRCKRISNYWIWGELMLYCCGMLYWNLNVNVYKWDEILKCCTWIFAYYIIIFHQAWRTSLMGMEVRIMVKCFIIQHNSKVRSTLNDELNYGLVEGSKNNTNLSHSQHKRQDSSQKTSPSTLRRME